MECYLAILKLLLLVNVILYLINSHSWLRKNLVAGGIHSRVKQWTVSSSQWTALTLLVMLARVWQVADWCGNNNNLLLFSNKPFSKSEKKKNTWLCFRLLEWFEEMSVSGRYMYTRVCVCVERGRKAREGVVPEDFYICFKLQFFAPLIIRRNDITTSNIGNKFNFLKSRKNKIPSNRRGHDEKGLTYNNGVFFGYFVWPCNGITSKQSTNAF